MITIEETRQAHQSAEFGAFAGIIRLHDRAGAPFDSIAVSLTFYGWPEKSAPPVLIERQREYLDELEVEVEFARNHMPSLKSYEAGCRVAALEEQLDPNTLLPTQTMIDPAVLAALDDAEDLPHAIVLLSNGKHYIHDGHHRATRAKLRGELLDCVVVNLEMIR